MCLAYRRIYKTDKRKRVVLPIEKKLEIISKFQKGIWLKQLPLSIMFTKGQFAVYKATGSIFQFIILYEETKTMKRSTYDNLDKALLY